MPRMQDQSHDRATLYHRCRGQDFMRAATIEGLLDITADASAPSHGGRISIGYGKGSKISPRKRVAFLFRDS